MRAPRASACCQSTRHGRERRLRSIALRTSTSVLRATLTRPLHRFSVDLVRRAVHAPVVPASLDPHPGPVRPVRKRVPRLAALTRLDLVPRLPRPLSRTRLRRAEAINGGAEPWERSVGGGPARRATTPRLQALRGQPAAHVRDGRRAVPAEGVAEPGGRTEAVAPAAERERRRSAPAVPIGWAFLRFISLVVELADTDCRHRLVRARRRARGSSHEGAARSSGRCSHSTPPRRQGGFGPSCDTTGVVETVELGGGAHGLEREPNEGRRAQLGLGLGSG